MERHREGFSLVEILIVVLILGILAMVVVPKFASSSYDAKDAALSTDLKSVRRQIELYTQQHRSRGPEVDEMGQLETTNFANRLTRRTTPEGALDDTGPRGPYLSEWPSNPFVDATVAQTITFGKGTVSPRNGTSGWYFSIQTRQIYVNSKEGAESVN